VSASIGERLVGFVGEHLKGGLLSRSRWP
jgi:hypothetical protein